MAGSADMLTNSRDIIRRLLQDGFERVSVRGSHHKFVHHAQRRVIVPHPKKDLPLGTVRGIHQDAGWEMTDWDALLHRPDPQGS